MQAFERMIVQELRTLTGNGKITINWIQEWSTGSVTAREGETLYHLPELGVNVAIKEPVGKPKKKEGEGK